MPRNSPITMTFPPFYGTVRKLVLANVAVFFTVLVLQWLVPALTNAVLPHLVLIPASVAFGQIWQLVTYSFVHTALLDILFAMLTLWFFGSLLEANYGTRWLAELYFTSAIGGAFLAAAISFTGILGLHPTAVGAGSWAALFGVMVALAVRMGDEEFYFWMIVRIKAKYLVAIYILIDLAMLLKSAAAFAVLLQLSGALCGYLYVRFAPRRGLAFGFSEQLYGIRNSYYRSKRRRAAKKFEVYMSKQGRKVHFDDEGRYLDPDEGRYLDPDDARRRDPNDKRWMN